MQLLMNSHFYNKRDHSNAMPLAHIYDVDGELSDNNVDKNWDSPKF